MNKLKKLTIPFFLLLTLMCAFFGCTKSEPQRVLLLLKTMDNPFFQDIEAGFRSKWQSSTITLDVLAGKNEADAPGQREILESYLRNYVRSRNKPLLKGIILTPSDSGDGLIPAIAELRQAGIPVILVDTAISPQALQRAKTDYNILFASDNKLGGESAGKALITALWGRQNTKVLILNGVPEHDTAKQRREGFLSAVKNFGCEIVERTANWRRSEARTIVEAFSNAGQVPDAIFAANDEMAIGAIEALRQKTASLPPIIGFDATDEARALVKEGLLYATIAQSPRRMGERAAEELSALFNGTQSQTMRLEPIPVKTVSKDKP